MKPTKDIRQCPLYPEYWADKEGHVYLDAEGKQEVGVHVENRGHLVTTTAPHAKVHRIVYYAFNPVAPVKGYDIHHINENKTDNRLENLQLLSHGEHTRLHRTGKTGSWHGKFGEQNPKSKPVLQYTMEGVLVAEYPCIKGAKRVTGVDHRLISAVCRHKRKTAGGCIWRFKDDPLLPEQISTHYNTTTSPKPVLQYTMEGVLVAEYASTIEAERATGVPRQNISKVCNHKYKTAGGFIWCYTSDLLTNIHLKLF